MRCPNGRAGSSPAPGTHVGGRSDDVLMAHVRPWSTVVDALSDSDAGMSDAANAEKHGVAVKTIRRWRRDYQRRGRPRGQSHLGALCPRCDEGELDTEAYSELLGWYLGDGTITRGRRGVFNLHVINDAKYGVANTRLLEIFRRVKPASRPHTRQVPGAVLTTVSWKHWPCLFPQHGPGRKHERSIVLDEWQQRVVVAHPDPFLRGLFHSDGSRVKNWATRPIRGASCAATSTRAGSSPTAAPTSASCAAGRSTLSTSPGVRATGTASRSLVERR